MSNYLDTSLLVAGLTREKKTDRVQEWLSGREAGSLLISEWVVTEFSAALSVKLRTRQINAEDRARALAKFVQLVADSLVLFPVPASCFHTAARFADQYGLGLRAGDALHLAIASERGSTLCTLDEKLAEASAALGVQSILL